MSGEPIGPDRRQFFREALRGVVRPLAEYLEGKVELPANRSFLRPPGAIEEGEFLDTCYRCGTCVETCPADAIKLRQVAGEAADGTPWIDADIGACAICDGLKCAHACPSGALQPLKHAYEIHMGLAVVSAGHCVRSKGEACTMCVDNCPIGTAAIRIVDRWAPKVSAGACVGCGMCQLHCPTQPKAVVVEPL